MKTTEAQKKAIITDILQVCAISNISDDKNIPMDKVFLSLAFLDLPELKKIALELNIKTT